MITFFPNDHHSTSIQTTQNIEEFDKKFVDKYGFILPQESPTGKPADNGVLFLSVAALIGFIIRNDYYKNMVRNCYLEKGLIARWPTNDFDQAAWDDYLGVAAASIHFKDTNLPREILWYGLKHAFFFNTDGKLKFEDFLGRHIHVWILMLVAAFPGLKFFMKPLLKLPVRFFRNPDMRDTSGFQLQWLYLYALKLIGIETFEFDQHMSYLKEAFGIYYAKDHPFNEKLKQSGIL